MHNVENPHLPAYPERRQAIVKDIKTVMTQHPDADIKLGWKRFFGPVTDAVTEGVSLAIAAQNRSELITVVDRLTTHAQQVLGSDPINDQIIDTYRKSESVFFSKKTISPNRQEEIQVGQDHISIIKLVARDEAVPKVYPSVKTVKRSD